MGRTGQKIFSATFGCQMNEYDSDRLLRHFSARGWTPTESQSDADLIFINTCTIRDKAEQKLFSYLGRLAPLKKKRPGLIIAVGGCLAQQHGDNFMNRSPLVDLVVGTHAVMRLPEMADEYLKTGEKKAVVDFDYNLAPPPQLVTGQKRLQSFLTIMQGLRQFLRILRGAVRAGPGK